MASYNYGGQNAMSYQGNNNFNQYQNNNQQFYGATYQNNSNAFMNNQSNNNNNAFPSNPPKESDDDDSDDWYETDSDSNESDSVFHRKSINIASLPTDSTTTNYIPKSQPVGNNYLAGNGANGNNNFAQFSNHNNNNNKYNYNRPNNNNNNSNQQRYQQAKNPRPPPPKNSSRPKQTKSYQQPPPPNTGPYGGQALQQMQSMSMRTVTKPNMLQQMSQSTSSLLSNNNNAVPPPPSSMPIDNIKAKKKVKNKGKKKKGKKGKKSKKKNKDKQHKIEISEAVPPPPGPPPPDNANDDNNNGSLFKPMHTKTLSIAPPPGLPRPPAYSYASTIAPDDQDLYHDQDENQKKDEKPELHGMSKREKAVAELISTEVTYVEQLEKLITLYMDKLEDKEKIINTKDWSHVFPSSLKTILNLNKQLLADLKKRKSENNDDDKLIISDILLGFTPYFKMYQAYMNNSTKQLAAITKCLDNAKFYNFQQETRRKCNNLTVSDMVILPVQRIPRYKLLVQEIFKRTEKDHPDFEGLEKALALIEKINNENNAKLKDLDSRMKVLNVTNDLEKAPNLSSPTRKFVFAGELLKIKVNGKLEKMVFYLFNDCMVYAAMPSAFGKKYIFKMRMPIDAAFAVQKIKDTKKYKNVMAIYSSLESFMVTTGDNTELKFKWMKIITKCIDNARHGHYYHANSRNARKGRGSVLISQASLQIPKQLKKELNKELSVMHMDQSLDDKKKNKKGKHQRFKTKHQIALLTDSDKLQVAPERGNTSNAELAIYGGRQRRKQSKYGMFSYSTGSGGALEPEDDLSDDEKEFFGISKNKSNHLKVSQSVAVLPGLDNVVDAPQIQRAGTSYNAEKRGTKPKMYAKRSNAAQSMQPSSAIDHNRAATAAVPSFGQISNNMGIPPPPPPSSSAPQQQQQMPPPIPPQTILASKTSHTSERRLSDPPPAPSPVVEATQQRLSVARRRSFGGSISQNKFALNNNNNNEMMKHMEYAEDEYEYDDTYDAEDQLMAPKQARRSKSTKPSSFRNDKKKNGNKYGGQPTPFAALSNKNNNNAIAMSNGPSFGCVIWRNFNVNNDDNKLLFRQMKNILTDVQAFANNQSVLQAVNEKIQITEDVLVVVNSQDESQDHELIRMLRENSSFDQEILLFNNKQNGKYRAPWLTSFSNIKFTQSQDEVIKHIKKFTKYAKLNSMMKSDEEDEKEVITKSNTFTSPPPAQQSINRQQTFTPSYSSSSSMRPPSHFNKTKSVNIASKVPSVSSPKANHISSVSSVASPKASNIAKKFTAMNSVSNNSYKSPGTNDALAVIKRNKFNAFREKDSDDEDDTQSNNNTSASFGRSSSQKITKNKSKGKTAKPYTGDPTIWNAYLDQHNGSEPANEWALHKFVKADKSLPTISFKQAREMFKGCKGRGRL